MTAQVHPQTSRPKPYALAFAGDSPMAPNTTTTTATLTDTYNANNTITSYAHALQNIQLVWNTSTMGPVPQWFTNLSASLAVAQTHGQYWIDTLGPAVFSTVPQTIINYTNTFNTDTSAVLQILSGLPPNQPPTPAQQASINAILDDVLATLRSQRQTLTDTHAQLVAFADNVQSDHGTLVTGKNAAQAAVLIDQGQLLKIQAKINSVMAKIEADSKKALASEIGIGVGVFVTVVAIGAAIATGGAALPIAVVCIGVVTVGAGIAGTVVFSRAVNDDLDELTQLQLQLGDEQRQVSALQGITNSTNSLVTANENALQAISQVLHMWDVLEKKLDAVSTQLKAAEAPQVKAIIETLHIQTAQIAWGQLAAFAQQMENNNITVQPTLSNTPQTPRNFSSPLLHAGLPPRRPAPRLAVR